MLPEKSGRLHATIRNARRSKDDVELLLFELCARGIPAEREFESIQAWYNLAHEWIVRGFADLTGEDVQDEVWIRKKPR
jgi:hypothetical protein